MSKIDQLKNFINGFDFQDPDWSSLPEDFPNCDLEGLNSSEVGKFGAIKVLWEANQPEKPRSRSRAWENPEGYKYLVQWSNPVLLRFLIRKFSEELPKSEYRRKTQINDAGRSIVRNIEEGYKRATTAEYINFIGYSQGSLEEVKGDIREATEDGFLKSVPGSSLADFGIDLGEFNQALRRNRGGYRNLKEAKGGYKDITELYPALKRIRGQDLTYETFLELINKTDWLLRKLVASLEQKLNQEQKAYQLEQARIREHLKWR